MTIRKSSIRTFNSGTRFLARACLQGDLQLSMEQLAACCTDRAFLYDYKDIPAKYRIGRIVAASTGATRRLRRHQ